MTLTEIRDLKAKAFLAMKAVFIASMQPITAQQIHPLHIAIASSLHQACCRELGYIGDDVDGSIAEKDHQALCIALFDEMLEAELPKEDRTRFSAMLDEIHAALDHAAAAHKNGSKGGTQA